MQKGNGIVMRKTSITESSMSFKYGRLIMS